MPGSCRGLGHHHRDVSQFVELSRVDDVDGRRFLQGRGAVSGRRFDMGQVDPPSKDGRQLIRRTGLEM